MVALINNALLHVVTAANGLRARLFYEEMGQDLIEYAVLGGLIAIAAAAAFVAADMSGALTTMATKLHDCLSFTSPCS